MSITHWRVGSKVGRTLYYGDRLVGLVDTEEIALEVIHALNARGRSLLEVAADSIRNIAEHLDRDDRDQQHIAEGMHRAIDLMRRIAATEVGGRPETARERSRPCPARCPGETPSLFGEPGEQHIHRCSWPQGVCRGLHHCECGTEWSEIPRDAERRSEATPQNDLPGEAVECICGRRIGTGRSGRFAGHDNPATGETCVGSFRTPLDASRVDPYDTKKGYTP